jgi:fluoride exporter
MHTPTDGSEQRPLHLQPAAILLVVSGGALGTLARYGVSQLLPPAAGWPLGTLAVNLTGAFALGVLLEFLLLRAPDDGGRRALRLVAATGFIGAFTTYSTLALEGNLLLASSGPGQAAAYWLLTLVGGFLASVAGIAAASRWRGRRV